MGVVVKLERTWISVSIKQCTVCQNSKHFQISFFDCKHKEIDRDTFIFFCRPHWLDDCHAIGTLGYWRVSTTTSYIQSAPNYFFHSHFFTGSRVHDIFLFISSIRNLGKLPITHHGASTNWEKAYEVEYIVKLSWIVLESQAALFPLVATKVILVGADSNFGFSWQYF